MIKKQPAILGGTPAFEVPLHVGRPNLGDRQVLLARINETLAEIAADGRYDRFVDYWMVQMIGSAELEAE